MWQAFILDAGCLVPMSLLQAGACQGNVVSRIPEKDPLEEKHHRESGMYGVQAMAQGEKTLYYSGLQRLCYQ